MNSFWTRYVIILTFMILLSACAKPQLVQEDQPAATSHHEPEAVKQLRPHPEYESVEQVNARLDETGKGSPVQLLSLKQQDLYKLKLVVDQAELDWEFAVDEFHTAKIDELIKITETRTAIVVKLDNVITNNWTYLVVVYENGEVIEYIPSFYPDRQRAIFSPNKDRLAYSFRYEENDLRTEKFGLLDLRTGFETLISLADDGINLGGYGQLTWIDDERLGFAEHVNPSLESYTVYDLTGQSSPTKYYGLFFTWVNGSLYYYLPPPHFSDIRGGDRIMNGNGNVLYESPEFVSIDGELLFDEDGNFVEFYESDDERTVKVTALLETPDKLTIMSKEGMYEERY